MPAANDNRDAISVATDFLAYLGGAVIVIMLGLIMLALGAALVPVAFGLWIFGK